jgi:hypothetical protein
MNDKNANGGEEQRVPSFEGSEDAGAEPRAGQQATDVLMPHDAVAESSRVPVPIASSTATYALGERLINIGRHPVMMFGTTSSGKSSILMSFINNLMSNPEVNIRLGEPIYPVGHPRREEAHNIAQDFFERKAQDFIHGRKLLQTTEAPYPLFVPIDIQRTHDLTPVKLAFLEGKGEWYEPQKQQMGSIFQDFREEVADVLKFYDGGLSAIFVAPCSDLDNEKRLRDNDVGLLGAINAYRRYRANQDEDTLLFLMTKWDVQANPLNNPLFGHLTADDVDRALRRQYPDSWPAFQTMPRPLQNDRRYFMQYCAGYLVDEANRPPPNNERYVFERYPRTLLNWIFGNATRKHTGTGRATRERVLFDDVIAKDALRVRYFERVTNFIFR